MNHYKNMISDKEMEAALSRMMEAAADTPAAAKERRPAACKPFVLEGVADCVREAHAESLAFCEAVMERKAGYWLTLAGRSGCGKTHLLDNARATLAGKGVEVQRWRWKRILDTLREGKDDLLRHLAGLRVLLLDDLGAEFTGTGKSLDFSLSVLLEMLELRAGRFTMLTTNYQMKDLAEAESRAASRLTRGESRVVNMAEAADYALLLYKAARGKK